MKNVQIDQQTTEKWSTDLNVTLSVSEGVIESMSDTIIRRSSAFKNSFEDFYLHIVTLRLISFLNLFFAVKFLYSSNVCQ